jgi:hypothetical protein
MKIERKKVAHLCAGHCERVRCAGGCASENERSVDEEKKKRERKA